MSAIQIESTFYKAIRITDLAASQELAPDHLRQLARKRLSQAIRACTDTPIRFAIIRYANNFDPREGGGIEIRAFAGHRAVEHIQEVRAARKFGVMM